MRIDRKWTVLILLVTVLLVVTGCSKKEPDVAPPAVTEPTPPQQDVPEQPAPAPVADTTEKEQPKPLAQIEEEARAAGLLGDVFFDFDKYDLRPSARERLAKNAEFMKQNRDLIFTVEGHCDERGTNEYNLALGQNRSDTAVGYLVSLGVPSSRFKTVSFGEERPFCTESDEACWQKNRRARFVISDRS
ncbi:MAG: peptidoglycan-associated lipoprotein Pal [Acidobacteriota bacterium]